MAANTDSDTSNLQPIYLHPKIVCIVEIQYIWVIFLTYLCKQFLHPRCHGVPKQIFQSFLFDKFIFIVVILDWLSIDWTIKKCIISVESSVKSLLEICKKFVDKFKPISLCWKTIESVSLHMVVVLVQLHHLLL